MVAVQQRHTAKTCTLPKRRGRGDKRKHKGNNRSTGANGNSSNEIGSRVRECGDNQHQSNSPDPRHTKTLPEPLTNKRTRPGQHNGVPDTERGARGKSTTKCRSGTVCNFETRGKCKFFHPKDKEPEKYTKRKNSNARRAQGGPQPKNGNLEISTTS